MKATVLKNNLKDGLGKVERAVTQKDGLLILRNLDHVSDGRGDFKSKDLHRHAWRRVLVSAVR